MGREVASVVKREKKKEIKKSSNIAENPNFNGNPKTREISPDRPKAKNKGQIRYSSRFWVSLLECSVLRKFLTLLVRRQADRRGGQQETNGGR